MKELPLSNCEKSFITRCIQESQRLDGRGLNDFRPLRIKFGSEWGSVYVSLGATKVIAQVSCEVAQPKNVRPNEGLLYINVDIGPMAAPHFEKNRQSDLSVHVNKLLERAYRDSRCVDLESLCIVAEEKVWKLRVDINVLNHEGNIVDCASVAALSALAHFKRPDVTMSGNEVIIHTPAERDPIKIPLHHYPVTVSYSIFNKGKMSIADPTAVEERVAEACIVFGLNSYKELCGLHLSGITLTSSELLLGCASKAAVRAKETVDMIKNALQTDNDLRLKGKIIGFQDIIGDVDLVALKQEHLIIKLKKFKLSSLINRQNNESDVEMESENEVTNVSEVTEPNPKVILVDKTSALLLPTVEQNTTKKMPKASWILDMETSEDDDDNEDVVSKIKCIKPNKKKIIEQIDLDESSEEESTVMI